MQDAAGAGGPRLANHRPRIVLGVAGVDDERLPDIGGELDLRRESSALGIARRVVVVVIETTLAYRDRRIPQQLA
jgi:hypothetical protein